MESAGPPAQKPLCPGKDFMTAVDVSFRYGMPPGEAEMRALGSAREVYGIRALRFDEKNKTVSVEFDATRLNEKNVESLLRRAGLDLTEKISLS
jgi:hypothetical protein